MKFQFSPGMDRLQVRINDDTDESNPVKDVVVETTTTITVITNTVITKDEDDETVKKTYTFTELAELPKGYTYIPSSIKPEIQRVVPDEIHVVKEDETNNYVIPQDLMIGIYGRNFTVSRYEYNGETRVSYPIIKFGNDVEINKNKDADIELYVMDDSGNIMDGTLAMNQAPKSCRSSGGSQGIKIPTDYVDTNVSVVVTNPIRNSAELVFLLKKL